MKIFGGAWKPEQNAGGPFCDGKARTILWLFDDAGHWSSERFVDGARCPLHGSPNVAVPREGLLETEVRHGEAPKWSGPIVGRYAVTVVGYYTDRPDRARAGVRRVEWQSDAQAKRRAEMLALRAAFLDWFVEEWVREGGVREDGVHQILGYPLR